MVVSLSFEIVRCIYEPVDESAFRGVCGSALDSEHS